MHCFSQELFKRVVPYHCLGGIWSQRDKKGKEHLAPTIRATVSQFNSVTNCVIATCLDNRSLRPFQRAKRIEHWIEVARVRLLVFYISFYKPLKEQLTTTFLACVMGLKNAIHNSILREDKAHNCWSTNVAHALAMPWQAPMTT